jgi:hypothetical protein
MLLNGFTRGALFEEPSGGADGGGVVAAPPPATSGDSAPSVPSEGSSDFGPGTGRSVQEGASAFSDVVDHFTRDEGPVPPAVTAPRPLATPPTPTVPGVGAVPPQPAAAQAQPAAPVVGQPTGQVPGQAQQQAWGGVQAQQQAAAYQQKRNATIAELERAYSNFSEEEKLQLMTEPHLILPKMLARAQADALEYTIRSVAQMIPQLTQATIVQNVQEHQALETFYGQFPDLRTHPQGEQTIWEIGNAYIAANPHADAATRMQMIGLLSRARLGLLSTSPQATAATPSSPQPMPLLPPYTPSGVGGSAVPSSGASALPYLDDILHLRRI